jgi:hypothetical protein
VNDYEKVDAEHDEFLARSLVFGRIAQICRRMDPRVIAESIKRLADNPDLMNPDIKSRETFSEHWRAAYDYALDQCEIRSFV